MLFRLFTQLCFQSLPRLFKTQKLLVQHLETIVGRLRKLQSKGKKAPAGRCASEALPSTYKIRHLLSSTWQRHAWPGTYILQLSLHSTAVSTELSITPGHDGSSIGRQKCLRHAAAE